MIVITMKWTLMVLMAVGCRGQNSTSTTTTTTTTQVPPLEKDALIYYHIGRFEVDNGAPRTSIRDESISYDTHFIDRYDADPAVPFGNNALDISVIDDHPAMIFNTPTRDVTCAGKTFMAVSGAMPTADTLKYVAFFAFELPTSVFEIDRRYYTFDFSIVPMKFETIIFARSPDTTVPFARVASASVFSGCYDDDICLSEYPVGQQDLDAFNNTPFSTIQVNLTCNNDNLTLSRSLPGHNFTAAVVFNATTIGASAPSTSAPSTSPTVTSAPSTSPTVTYAPSTSPTVSAANNGGAASEDEVQAIVKDAVGDLKDLITATLIIVGLILAVGLLMVMNPLTPVGGTFSVV
jgi:hypothetical protein